MKDNNVKTIEILFVGIIAGYLTFYWFINILYLFGVIDFMILQKFFHRGSGYSEYTSFLLFPIILLVNSVFFIKNKKIISLYFFAYLVCLMIGILVVIL
jgi:hypothetical protein